MARGVAFVGMLEDAWRKRYPTKRYTDVALARDALTTTVTLRRWRDGAIPDLVSLINAANAVDISVLDVLTALQGRGPEREPDPLDRIAESLAEINAKIGPRVAWTPEQRERHLRNSA